MPKEPDTDFESIQCPLKMLVGPQNHTKFDKCQVIDNNYDQ